METKPVTSPPKGDPEGHLILSWCFVLFLFVCLFSLVFCFTAFSADWGRAWDPQTPVSVPRLFSHSVGDETGRRRGPPWHCVILAKSTNRILGFLTRKEGPTLSLDEAR